jgi:hypothetical protein
MNHGVTDVLMHEGNDWGRGRPLQYLTTSFQRVAIASLSEECLELSHLVVGLRGHLRLCQHCLNGHRQTSRDRSQAVHRGPHLAGLNQMDSLPSELAARNLCQAEAGTRSGKPKHIRLDVDSIEAAARPTRPHCDRNVHPVKVPRGRDFGQALLFGP